MIDLVSFLKEKPTLNVLKNTLLLQKGTKFRTASITIQKLLSEHSCFVICVDNENNKIYFCPPLTKEEITNLKSSNYFILTYLKETNDFY